MSPIRGVIASLCAALVCGLVLAFLLLNTPPSTLTATDHDAQIFLQVANLPLLSSCMATHWRADNVTALELNGRGVIGAGDRRICADQVALQVQFRDGTSQTYTLNRPLLTDSLINRLLIALIVYLLGLVLFATGLPSRLSRHLFPRRLTSTLCQPVTVDQRRWLLWAAVGIVLIGAAVRTAYLSKPLLHDEAWTVLEFASKPLAIALNDYSSTNNQPLNTLLVHLSLGLFGLQVWTIHLPLYFAGILVVAASFAVGRRFYNPTVGLFAAALAASASGLVVYSVTARGYILGTLFFLLLLLVASALLRRRRLRLWLLFVLLSCLGLYTVASMAYGVGLVAVWLLLSILRDKRGSERRLWLRDLFLTGVLIALISGILYFPAWRYVQAHGGQSQLDLESFDPLLSRAAPAVYAEALGQIWDKWNAPWTLLQGLLVIGTLAAILFHPRTARFRVGLITALVLWLLPALFIPLLPTYPRIWLFLEPLYFVVAGAGLFYLGQRIFAARPGLTYTALLLLAAVLTFSLADRKLIYTATSVNGKTNGNLSVEQAIQAVVDDMRPGDIILCNWFCPAFVLQGQIKGVPLKNAVGHNDTLVDAAVVTLTPPNRLYIVTRDAKSLRTERLQQFLRRLNLPADALAETTILVDLTDSTVFRLEFKRPISTASSAADG